MAIDLLARRRLYERRVKALAARGVRLLADGLDEESVARILVDKRNRLKVQFREGLDSETLTWIENRNIGRYGNPVGPGPDDMFARYGSWRKVIEAAARPARLS